MIWRRLYVNGSAMKKDDFRHVTVFEIPGITHHDPVPAEWLEKILSALDGG